MLSSTATRFSQLSLHDLVEARELFHAHLINKKNVVATALGRYLIRVDDLDDNGNYNTEKKKGNRKKESPHPQQGIGYYLWLASMIVWSIYILAGKNKFWNSANS